MPDREKVINALECCIDGMLCAECDYEGIERCFDKVLLTDVLALLQEQEAEISRISNAYLELVGKVSKQPNEGGAE